MPQVMKFSALTDRINNITSRPGCNHLYHYDRNGMRLAIAALEDETRELWEAWHDGRIRHTDQMSNDPTMTYQIATELLDIAAVAMIAYSRIPLDNPPAQE